MRQWLVNLIFALSRAIAPRTGRWLTSNHVVVTHVAREVGMGFATLGAPVALTRAVWDECVQWNDQDSERQDYQEQDARLWDVLFTGGASLRLSLNKFVAQGMHRYSIECVPRDGASTDALRVDLVIRPTRLRGRQWLVIDKARSSKPLSPAELSRLVSAAKALKESIATPRYRAE